METSEKTETTEAPKKKVAKKKVAARTLWRDGECVRWAADAKARRVPLFVIETTGLKTKRKIVAKYGHGVTFDKTPRGTAKVVVRGERE